jgi:hypothetical protein
MKSASVHHQSKPMQPFINRSIATRKVNHQVQKPPNTRVQPSPEMIHRLNELGKQHPFCINFKQKRHDPL